MRSMSKVSPTWWDFTTLDKDLLEEAASLTDAGVLALQRDGFQVNFFGGLPGRGPGIYQLLAAYFR